jgi:PST family polysaccharide transporter
MGQYNLAFSLAETPLTYVADRISDVLMPSFSKMEPEERPAAVIRAAGIMSLIVAPLGVGLGAIAPTIVKVFFDVRWAGMAPMLMILSVMTVFMPAPWSAIAYLQTERHTRAIMIASIIRAIVLLGLVLVLGLLGGALWACVGVGLGAMCHAAFTILLTAKATRMSGMKYVVAVARPLLACVPMFLSVAIIRGLLATVHAPLIASLVAQVLVGAVVYVGAAFLFARPLTSDVLSLARGAMQRRSADEPLSSA